MQFLIQVLYATAKTVKLRLLQRTAAMSHHADVMLETRTLSKQDVLLLQLLNYFREQAVLHVFFS